MAKSVRYAVLVQDDGGWLCQKAVVDGRPYIVEDLEKRVRANYDFAGKVVYVARLIGDDRPEAALADWFHCLFEGHARPPACGRWFRYTSLAPGLAVQARRIQ